MSDNCLPAGLWKTEIMKYDRNNPGAQQVIEQSAGLRVGERFINSKTTENVGREYKNPQVGEFAFSVWTV